MLTHIGVSGVNFFHAPTLGVFQIKTGKSQNNPFIFACVTKTKHYEKQGEVIRSFGN